MAEIKIDPRRLDVLERLNLRESSAVRSTQERRNSAIAARTEVDLQIAAISQRNAGGNFDHSIAPLNAEKVKLTTEIDRLAVETEIATERWRAAGTLHSRCAQFLEVKR
jgi:hypothetical protein